MVCTAILYKVGLICICLIFILCSSLSDQLAQARSSAFIYNCSQTPDESSLNGRQKRNRKQPGFDVLVTLKQQTTDAASLRHGNKVTDCTLDRIWISLHANLGTTPSHPLRCSPILPATRSTLRS